MDKIIGVLGGGQLGRMLTEAANRLNISIVTLDSENCPAKQVNAHAAHINGSFTDPQAIHCLAARCDILTIETEHVNTDVLEHVANSVNIPRAKVEVQPSWRTIRTIQDKYKQKVFLKGNEISVADSQTIADATAGNIQEVAEDLGYPIMLKSRTEAYDGKGNYPVKSAADIPEALEKLKDRPLYAEQWANFVSELAVMVIKIDEDSTDSWEKATMAYPVVETIHENSICKLVYAPARNVSTLLMQKAQSLARRAVARFEGRGVFGVELFLLDDGTFTRLSPR